LKINVNEIEELFPFYALGVLTPEEKARVEAYIQSDPTAKARLEELLATAQALPYDSAPTPPASAVKTTLMARVRADQAPSRRGETPPTQWLDTLRKWLASPALSLAALAGLVLLGIWTASLQMHADRLIAESRALQATITSLSSENDTLRDSFAQLQQENDLLRDQILSDEDLIALLTDPQRQEIPVAGTEHQPEAQATLLVGTPEDTRAVLLVANLPALPAGRIYQFWLIGDGVPVGAGLFQSNAQGQGVLVVNSDTGPVLSFDAIGVSIEPEGGSEQPTGNIVLLGSLQGGS
jgi:anti-sigma-K factor RskA